MTTNTMMTNCVLSTLILLLLMLSSQVVVSTQEKANRQLYSTTGMQAYMSIFSSPGCSGDISATIRSEEQEWIRSAYSWGTNGVYNSYYIDCDDYGVGTVQYSKNGGSSSQSEVYATPTCVTTTSPNTYLSFYCVRVNPIDGETTPPTTPTIIFPTASPSIATGVPTRRPTTQAPAVKTKRPTNFPTPPTFKPTSEPTYKLTPEPTVEPTSMPTSRKPTNQPTFPPADTEMCGPIRRTNQAMCKEKLAHCSIVGAPMKWAGSGCKINGVFQQDGGCQCARYCGYKCETVCNRDSNCQWQNNQCVHKVYGYQTPKQSCLLSNWE